MTNSRNRKGFRNGTNGNKANKSSSNKQNVNIEETNNQGLKDSNLNKEPEKPSESKSRIWSWLAFLISVASFISSCQNSERDIFNKSLILNKQIELEYINDDTYKMSIEKKQGGIKKAYIADIDIEDDAIEIIYKESTDNIVGNQLEIKMQTGVTGDVSGLFVELIDENLGIKDIKQFALVVLDTTDQWNIYYCIIQPEINPDLVYQTILEANGKVIGIEQKEMKKQDMIGVLIDGTLINVPSIKNEMSVFDNVGKYYFYDVPLEIKGENGEIIKSNPYATIEYSMPEAETVYKNMQNIYEDIKNLKE